MVRSLILGFNDRGVDAFVENVAPDVEFHPPKESFEPGIYRGPDGVRTYWERIGETSKNGASSRWTCRGLHRPGPGPRSRRSVGVVLWTKSGALHGKQRSHRAELFTTECAPCGP
jgi:hypothetical protein